MISFFKKTFIFLCLLVMSACSSSQHGMQIKSPCVDNGGPCQHIPVNNWWLHDELIYKA